MQGYMIKNVKTGEYFQKASYSSGCWSATAGDIWSKKRHVLDTLKNNAFLRGTYAPVDLFEVVLVEIVELKTWSVADFKDDIYIK